MSCGGKIAIFPGQSEAEEFSTLVHELAHEMLHKASRLIENLEVIQQTSGLILSALQPPTAAEAEMPDAELAKVA